MHVTLCGDLGENPLTSLVSTEMLEHVIDWKHIVSNLKALIKEEGLLFITTRSKGFNIMPIQ